MLAPMGLRLSVEKTRVCHIDEGFDFLGWRIQRRAWRSRTGKQAVYTYPSKKALASIMDKVRTLTRRAKHRTLADLLRRLNPVLRGWCNYFRHGVSARTFGYVDHFAFWRIVGWLRKRHLGLNMHTLVRRFLPGWKIRAGDDRDVPARQRSRSSATATGAPRIPTPWSSPTRITRQRHEHVESRMRWNVARPVRRAGRGNPPAERPAGRRGPTPTPSIPPARARCTARSCSTRFSRRVVGWSIDSSQTAALATNALGMAIAQPVPTVGHGDPLRPWSPIHIMDFYQACQGFWASAIDGFDR